MIIDVLKPRKKAQTTIKETIQEKKVLVEKKLASKTKKTSTSLKPAIVIDYPKTGERINSNHYSIRIGTTQGNWVEISINKGSWQKCRESNGYFWYDWYGAQPGKHILVARLKSSDEKFKKSKEIYCFS